MRRIRAPRPGESQDAPREAKPGAKKFRSRWDLEEDRVVRHLTAAGWRQNRIVGALFEVKRGDFSGLQDLARQAGSFNLYTDARYEEFGL